MKNVEENRLALGLTIRPDQPDDREFLKIPGPQPQNQIALTFKEQYARALVPRPKKIKVKKNGHHGISY